VLAPHAPRAREEVVTIEGPADPAAGNLCRRQDHDKILMALMRGAKLLRG
jgi:hypothetical protein